MKRTMTLALTVSAATAAILGPMATAHAAPEYLLFTDPTGNVKCQMTLTYKGDPWAECVVRNAAYTVHDKLCDPPDRFNPVLTLTQGDTQTLLCAQASDDTPGDFVLDIGQTRSFGMITCDSEDFGVTCTDATTGRYFRAGTGSYDLG